MEATTALAWSTLGGPGDTWGISGPAFLLMYVLIALAVWIAGTQARRTIAGAPLGRPGVDAEARPYDIAYLNGGPDLAVNAALGAMHRTGAITSSRGRVSAAGRVEPGADPLERAIHLATGVPVARTRLQHNRTVRGALDTIHARLVSGGLLMSEDDRRRYRAVGWWTVGLAALGLARLLAGIAAAKPVGHLVVCLLVVSVVAVVQLARAPRRTRSGDRVLATLRAEHHTLAPVMRPDWAVYGAGGAALGVALFGTSALWASDPAFADELELQRAASGSGASYAGGGDSGGGDSGGGGGCGGGGCGGGCGG